MTNRNNNIWSKKTFFSHLILFLLTSVGTVHTGLIELYDLKTADGKSIILAGDDHSLYNFQEIVDLITLIKAQEQKDKSITLLVEQALIINGYTDSFTAKSMVVSLLKYLTDEHLSKTIIKNIEVRIVSNAVLRLLNEYTDLDCLSSESFFQCGFSGQKIMVNDITFQHVYNEYNSLKETLSMHYQKYDDVSIQEGFEQHINTAGERYEDLLYIFDIWKEEYGINEHEPIVNLIKKLKHAEFLKLDQDIDPDDVTLREELQVYICRVFIPLFNINAFDHIMQQNSSSDILLVAGASHARVMKNWLISCNKIVENNESIDATNSNIVTSLTAILHA